MGYPPQADLCDIVEGDGGVDDEKGRARKNALKLMREDVLARLAEDNPRYEK